MHSFLCNCSNKSLKLNEHIDFKWLTINELNKLDWAEADIPIMQKLLETL
jgi:8-oxo-dGTP diphosphatase